MRHLFYWLLLNTIFGASIGLATYLGGLYVGIGVGISLVIIRLILVAKLLPDAFQTWDLFSRESSYWSRTCNFFVHIFFGVLVGIIVAKNENSMFHSIAIGLVLYPLLLLMHSYGCYIEFPEI
ncbi:MAG: hypothetical protein AAF518_24185 [Spirochaetota bacterium]